MTAARNASSESEPSELPEGQARRRQRIIDEAYKLIAERGQENVHIREIAESAGVALGTAYRYFGSKERLVAEVYAQWLEGRTRELARYVDKGRTNTERVRVLALRMFDILTGDPHFLRLSRQDLRGTSSPEVIEIIARSEQDWVVLFRSALKGVEERDADSIALTIASVVALQLDRYLSGMGSFADANRLIAKAVKMVLEFRDPALEADAPTDAKRHQRPSPRR